MPPDSSPPPLPAPLDFAAAMRDGGTFHGEGVARLVLVLADGRRVTADLPAPGGGARLSPAEARVVDLFREHPAGSKFPGKVIAKLLDQPEGSVRKHLAALVRAGALANGDEGYGRGERFPD
jgi:hypothetical protein